MSYEVSRSYPDYIYTESKLLLESFVLYMLSLTATLLLVETELLTISAHTVIGSLLVWVLSLLGFGGYMRHHTSDDSKDEYIPDPDDVLVWLILAVGSVSLYLYLSVSQELIAFEIASIILLAVPITYTYRLFSLYDLYAEEPIVHTDKHSIARTEWNRASAAFTRAIHLWDSGKQRHSILGVMWSLLAVGRYQTVMETTKTRNMRSEHNGANRYTQAAFALHTGFIRRIYSTKKARQNFSDFEKFLDEAEQELSFWFCDRCGGRHKPSEMYRILDEEGIEEHIYCDTCYDSRNQTTSSSEYTSRSNKTQSSNSNKQQSSSKSTSSSSEYKSSSNKRQTSNFNQTQTSITDALQTLEIDRPISEGKVTQAYREKVKDVHPDTKNGDSQEFKRVKDAKNRLLEEI